MERACCLPRPHCRYRCRLRGQLLRPHPCQKSWRTPRSDDLLHLRLRRHRDRWHVRCLHHESRCGPLISSERLERKIIMATTFNNEVTEKVNGPVSAALLAGGIGSAAMGLITPAYEINDKSAFAQS